MLIYVTFMKNIFNTAAVGFSEWCFALDWAPIIVVIDELRKLFIRMGRPSVSKPS
jgi:hypothetical protein